MNHNFKIGLTGITCSAFEALSNCYYLISDGYGSFFFTILIGFCVTVYIYTSNCDSIVKEKKNIMIHVEIMSRMLLHTRNKNPNLITPKASIPL
jgi:hypothetical protein